MTRRARLVAAGLAMAILATACGGPPSDSLAPGSDADALRVVTTTTILADMVRQVGGPRVSVESLVPAGGEVHTFDPRPSDIRRLADADVVFLNGLGMDGWLAGLVADAGTGAPVIALGENLDGVQYIVGGPGGDAVNPHLWLNVAYAAKYAERIGQTLAIADPAHAAALTAGAVAYMQVLADLDQRARSTLGTIPEADRTVIAFHDAFSYFAAAYGLTIDGTIVNAPGQDPSAGQVAELVRVIEDNHVRAIFAEAQFSDALVRTIAAETGVHIVSDLYTDSVGDPPQDTYVGMMTWNIEQVTAVLTNE